MTAMELALALEDFRQARRQANLERILAHLTGQSAELLSYEDVRQKLKARESGKRKLEDIPLDAIIGSVGRYKDFTRSFLPTQDSYKERWARVEVAVKGLSGLPPIEVYQIGQTYFVKDGNHRVSVARQLGATHIQAFVTEVRTKVPLSPDTDPDDLILKTEYADFLEHTHIDELRPDADLSVTVPGQYQILEEHIEVHRHFMGLEKEREIPYEEAVTHWYDEVYSPVARLIREQGLLRDFPDRTETDLYLWIMEHRAALEEELGWGISSEKAAADLSDRFSPRKRHIVTHVKKLLDTITPDELETGPPPGQWRQEHLTTRWDDRLFADILVAITGEETGWCALDQALIIARREEARLNGLHVVPSEAQRESEEAQAVKLEFNQRCKTAGVSGRLALEVGKVQRKLSERARWTDLMVLSLNYPPAPQPIAKLSSGLLTLIRRCPSPVLTVPGTPSNLNHALLAYDGSPKAEEALFVATYISGRWDIPLTVVSALKNKHVTSETMIRAREYLEAHGAEATFVEERGAAATVIMETAERRACDLIIMGGYGVNPVLEITLGSTVDQTLRESRLPTLICR